MSIVTPLIPQEAKSKTPIRRDLLTPAEAAELLRLSVKTLDNDRCTRRIGIPFVKMGRAVRYRLSDIESFIAGSVVA